MSPNDLPPSGRRSFLGHFSALSMVALLPGPGASGSALEHPSGERRGIVTVGPGSQGTGDDAPRLQAAIRATPVGGVLKVAPGDYTLGTRLLVDREISIEWGAGAVQGNGGWLFVTANGVSVEGAGGGRTRIACERPWDGSNLFGVEAQDVTGFTLAGVDIDVRRTGMAVHPSTNCMGVFIHGRSDRFLVERNRISATGTEPDHLMRYLGIFAWTAAPKRPILCGDGMIRGNWIVNTAGRCIEVALCQNVSIVGNVVSAGGTAATIVCVGVRVIGSENISVVGNAIDITGGAELNNADCLQVNGDNVSVGVVLTGNACRTDAGGGTGIKIGGNASHVAVTGNTVWYTGTSDRPRGILVTSNPPAPALPPTSIAVVGNVVWGFQTQLELSRATPEADYPTNVSFMGNHLGNAGGGKEAAVNFVDMGTADLAAQQVTLRGNAVEAAPGANEHGDADAELSPLVDGPVQEWSRPLGAAREVRFAANGAQRGDQFRVVRAREATGDVPLTVQTTPPRPLAAGEWCDVAFIGRGWRVTAAGSL